MKEKDRSKEQSWKKKIEPLEVKNRMIKIKNSRISTSKKDVEDVQVLLLSVTTALATGFEAR